jgi:hypothetical protein
MCALAERGMTIRAGLLVGDNTVSPYDGDRENGKTEAIFVSSGHRHVKCVLVQGGSEARPALRVAIESTPVIL